MEYLLFKGAHLPPTSIQPHSFFTKLLTKSSIIHKSTSLLLSSSFSSYILTMCNPKDWIHSPPTSSTHHNCQHKQQQSRRCKVRVQCLVIRRRFEETKTENMELKNLHLYLENRNILEENEKLRQKAIRLRLENQALLSEYQKKITSSQTGT